MNVIIVAVCVNIALVNANNDIDLNTILRIIKGRRSTKQEGVDDSVDEMRIIPGFYLETPKSASKSLFRLPKNNHSDVYGRFNMDKTKRHKEKKSRDSNISLRRDLMSKILGFVKNLDRFGSKEKYEQAYEPKSDDQLLVQNMLAKFIIGEGNINGLQGYQTYDKSVESNPKIRSKSADRLLVEKLLANIANANEIESNDEIDDRETYKYGTTDENIWSSDSRYGNVLQQLLETVQNSKQYRGPDKRSSLIVVETKPKLLLRSLYPSESDTSSDQSTSLNSELTVESENNANEVLGEYTEDETDFEEDFYDRHRHHHHTRRLDENCTRDSMDVESSGGSSEVEKNPGNPFTVHRNKYKQNWLWNHFMDGNHMNINPFGPQFGSLGPTGPELFFGRKWWYFNQDDYKPMG